MQASPLAVHSQLLYADLYKREVSDKRQIRLIPERVRSGC